MEDSKVVKKPCYKYCIVPCCTNTTYRTPGKLFFSVPKDELTRKRWCKAIHRDEKKNKEFSSNSSLHCCEDHFSLENDMENYWQHRLSDSYKKIKLKPGVLPSFFECQKKDSPRPIQGKCSIPGCRGNHSQSSKAAVFEFPTDIRLRKKWIRAIPKKKFRVTKNSRVCERHFRDAEVIRSSTFRIEKTGEVISAPMRWLKLKENVVPSIFPDCSSSRRKIPSKKPRRIKTDLGTEFQAETTSVSAETTSVSAETSVVVKQEPEESVDEPSQPVIEKVVSTKELPSYSSASSTFNIPLVPVYVFPIINPYFANLNQIPATRVSNTATQKREISKIELDAKSVTPEKSLDEPPQLVDEKLLSSEELLSSSNILSSTFNIPTAPVYVLPIVNPDSTNLNRIPTHGSSIATPKRKINNIELDANVIIPDKLVDEPPQPIDEELFCAEELLSSSSNSSTSFSEMGGTLNVLPDSTNLNHTSATHISNTATQKRKINGLELDSNHVNHKTSQGLRRAKLCRRAKPSTSSKKNSDLPQHAGTSKKFTRRSTLSTKNDENAAREIFRSLIDGSKSNPLLNSRTAGRTGDLFHVFSDFIADKLRNMDKDDCASAVRTILDVIFKSDKVQHGNKNKSGISSP